MKISIDRDELYPFYFPANDERHGEEIEATDAEAAWITATLEEFDKVQAFLESKVKAVRAAWLNPPVEGSPS